MEPCVVLGLCPLHANFHAIVLLLELKAMRVQVASSAAASSRNTQLWAEMFCGLMQCAAVTAGCCCPLLALWLIVFHSPDFALRLERGVRHTTSSVHRQPVGVVLSGPPTG